MRAIDRAGLATSGGSSTPLANPNEFNVLDLTPIAGDAGSYVHPTQGTSDFGPYPDSMSKRNAFRGPGRYFLDLSVSKRFRFGSHYAVQLRGEAFNILNHANLYVLGGTADVGSGFVTGARGQAVEDARRVLLGAKFEF